VGELEDARETPVTSLDDSLDDELDNDPPPTSERDSPA
jgi:hypothetical protein